MVLDLGENRQLPPQKDDAAHPTMQRKQPTTFGCLSLSFKSAQKHMLCFLGSWLLLPNLDNYAATPIHPGSLSTSPIFVSWIFNMCPKIQLLAASTQASSRAPPPAKPKRGLCPADSKGLGISAAFILARNGGSRCRFRFQIQSMSLPTRNERLLPTYYRDLDICIRC